MIQKSGISPSKIRLLVSLFLNFAKSNAREGIVQKLLAKAPGLRNLAG